MNMVFALDLVCLVSVLCGMGILLLNRARKGDLLPFGILLGLFALDLFHSSSNTLEWSGVTSRFDEFEDFITVVQPVIWLFFLHAFLDARVTYDLKRALREKEILLKEVHHRVKNNLLTLYSLVNLQQISVEDKKIVSDALQDTKQRIQAMGRAHQMLYNSENFSEIDFAAYIQTLVDEMKEPYGADQKNIDVIFDLDPVVLFIETAIPCALILNEVLVNAFKHAFTGRSEGHIVITLKKRDRAFELKISDNGIGMPEDIMSTKQKTLGLRLIDMLSQQLHGSVSYKRQNGSIFTITFMNTSG